MDGYIGLPRFESKGSKEDRGKESERKNAEMKCATTCSSSSSYKMALDVCVGVKEGKGKKYGIAYLYSNKPTN